MTNTGAASYGYDPVGNRLSRSGNLLSSQNLTFDANDHQSTDTYDANGNTLTAPGFGQSQADQYDFENHLTTRYNSGNTVTVKYDGDGNRVSKTVTTSTNTVTTLYLVDDQNPSGYSQVLEELTSVSSSQPVLKKTYTYGHSLISQTFVPTGNQSPETFFYGYDGHNNVRYLTDANGNVTDTYDYDAYGNLIAATGTTGNPYLFTGEQYDSDLGLYYLRARYQDPITGRFWTSDTFDGISSDPVTLHKYIYVHCDPLNKIDPSGLIATTAEIGYTSALIGAFEKTLIVASVALYTAHYADRDYTVYSCFGVDPQYGWGHAFVALWGKYGYGWRYDLFPRDLQEYRRAKRNPLDYFEGQIEKEVITSAPGGVAVAKFNPGHIGIWECVIQGQAFSLQFRPGSFPFENQYSYYLENCYLWAAAASLAAVPISILPFPNTFGHFF